MKILSVALLLVACIAFVLLGCSDNSALLVTPASVDHNSATSLAKTSGSGAWIIKGAYDTYRLGFGDPNSGLVMMLGVNDWGTFCLPAHDQGMDIFNFRDIFLPNADPNLRRVLEQIKEGDISAYVWDLAQYQGTFCATHAIYTPKAAGTVKFVYTNNDVLAYMQNNSNSNAFGYKANGTLYGPDGQVYNLNFVYRYVWDPDGKNWNEVIKIGLTLTGKH